jgi:hypothetical protein
MLKSLLHSGRTARAAAAAAVCVTAAVGLTATPAMASTTTSFSAGSSPYVGDVYGTVTSVTPYKISVTAHLWNDTGAQLSWQLCYGYYDEDSANVRAGCNSMRYNNKADSLATWTNLTYTDSNARIEYATIELYKNGTNVGGDVLWALY